ncbi:WD40/YVTN/BNR-like repeat-containing protein [Aquimarina sediminis]|uniref:WD40/YVTN/BNR-like repeat-containing protein n=1 Tax=Aquimarina sediminis TaxID=2070536 RepID=UPI000CA0599C|nr:oxidoreductase [Aquimarina sediminis]
MRIIVVLLVSLIFIFSNIKDKMVTHNFSKVEIETLIKDSISIRALDIYNDSLIGFGFNKGYGFINLNTRAIDLTKFNSLKSDKEKKNWVAEQRAVCFTDSSFYSLGIGSPARLRKVNLSNREERIVYKEEHPKIFYDAISFWNDSEGIAIGDPTDNCLSIIITRDGGETWKKVSCNNLPEAFAGEAAFAASNGNIAIVGDKTWIISGGMKSRVYYSPNKGKTWNVYDTPIIHGKETTGAYSIDFYDENKGVIFGGDYTSPESNVANKAVTTDGGKTWQLVSDGNGAGYKSCVRYFPNGGGKEMIAVGFTGISISNDFGKDWREISKEGFYTLRFISDSVAIAAGKGRVAKLSFK